ncbi:MAG: hypothetical protein WBC73_21885 [Phormidesmis sp.]
MNLEKSRIQVSAILADFMKDISSKVSDAAVVSQMLDKINKWAGGQPLITEVLCTYIVKYSSKLTEGKEAALVDRIARQKIVKDWESTPAADHIRSIREALLAYGERDSLLIAYMRILQGGAIFLKGDPEQTFLLRSGLVTLVGDKLKVTNALYASIFDLKWIEAQLPGITRPVTIIRSKPESRKLAPPFMSSNFAYVKTAALVFAVGVLAAAGFAVFKPSKPPVAATTSEGAQPAAVGVSEAGTSEADVSEASVSANGASEDSALYVKNKDLFDRGVARGESGHWLPMLREFCGISKSSTYYAPAANQLRRWMALYGEDIKIAQDTILLEQGGTCVIVQEIVDQPL